MRSEVDAAARSPIASCTTEPGTRDAAAASTSLRIGHPLGAMEVKVVAERGAPGAPPAFLALGLTRTARRLMAGVVYVPGEAD